MENHGKIGFGRCFNSSWCQRSDPSRGLVWPEVSEAQRRIGELEAASEKLEVREPNEL